MGHFFSVDKRNNLEPYFTSIIKDNIENCFIVYRDVKILDYYPQYRKEQALFQKNKYYSELWKEKNIYK